MDRKPALTVIGTPGRRQGLLDIAAEADRRGFPAVAVAGLHGGTLAMCTSLVHVTRQAEVWSAIQPMYTVNAAELAGIGAHLHELSGGRFRLGLGVSHEPLMRRYGAATGRPLDDTRGCVDAIRGHGRRFGDLPPIVLATLRDRMLGLAAEVGDGAVWANAAQSHVAAQLDRVPAARRAGFVLANMIPTVVDADLAAARAVHRKTLTMYAGLPNYRNYWKQAGYVEEMDALEAALGAGERDRLPELMPDRWVDDCTISGDATAVHERVAGWYDLGVQPILVMSSTSGGQAKALGELLDAYA